MLMTKDEAKAHTKLTDIEEVPFNRVYFWSGGGGEIRWTRKAYY